MRLQVTRPDRHEAIADLPWGEPLAEWQMSNVHRVLGLHRHVVKLVECGGVSYVVKEIPDELAEREFRLLRAVDEAGLPTVEAVATATGRDVGDGLVVTRHLDYSLPYRSLLMGRGLEIPYLGDRLLDAMVVLLVRIHLAGFFWGDCSLSNILFRRDAGALQAYIIDLETAEQHDHLTDGQRALDVMIATDNMAGGLLDLQAGGRLKDGIDPIPVALAVEERYGALWEEIMAPATAALGDARPIRSRLDRLHELGFAIDEMEVETHDDGRTVKFIPKVVEHGYHREELASLTGLNAGDNQARRMLQDIKQFRADLESKSGKSIPLNVAAVRWLDRVFEPTIAAIPPDLLDRLEAAEIFHQLLEHRWYLSERSGTEIDMPDVIADYLGVLEDAPAERVHLDDEAAAEGDDQTAAAESDDQTAAAEGDDQTAAAESDDQTAAEGDDQTAAAGDDQTAAAEGAASPPPVVT